ncbi:ribonuclease YeeF family protein [Bacillus glycinifermentans]|uniref:ribonuclease YeeF family protein n=1 Tax=Bacillus glycinifermentans TaxID=1664069 RepID=UPI001E362FC9|nr:LXG domain-containing protein [Bacillus glycinifermentans]MEC0494475.1 LXG domain-containing protein [Bacillus glycinifermentans]MEC0539771.1 LXG domain-containing protein [Bacillus glycinifermentans]
MLDVQGFQNSLDQTLSELKNQKDDISKVKQSVKSITSLDDALKGAGGEAIRSFYEECHTTFLLFYESFISDYKGILEKTKSALHSLEPNQDGFISQSFLENELHDGVSQAESLTARLTAKANMTAATVSHIVSLPTLDDTAVNENAKKAQRQISDTLEKLHTFDREQTKALEAARQDLDTMMQYVEQLEKMYTGPRIEIQEYQSGSVLAQKSKTGDSSTIDGIDDSPMQRMLEKIIKNSDQTSSEDEKEVKSSLKKKNEKIEYTYDKSGLLGFYGAGNVYGSVKVDGGLTIKGELSLFDTNKAFRDKGMSEKPTSFKAIDAKFTTAIPKLQDTPKYILAGETVGLKIEGDIIDAEIGHEKSPVSFEAKFGHAQANANISEYTASIGGEASVAEAEITVNPLNWFGYEPLKEWFNIDIDPYVGLGVSIGSVGVGGSVGLENEIYAADGVGLSFKFGAKLEEE